MGYQRHIQKKSSQRSAFTPKKDPFAPRPFANGVQPRTAKLPTTDLLQPRPFAPPIQQEQEIPDLQTRLELGERAGFSAANISVFAPSTPPPPVQREDVSGEEVEEQREVGIQKQQLEAPPDDGIVQRLCDECEGELAEKEEKTPVQAKLTVGEAGDKYEQEADAVAAQVVSKINSPQTQQPVQRQLELGGESVPNITVMRQSSEGAGGGSDVTQDVEQGIQQAKGGGQGIDESVREPMEGAFGADFSGVRVHTDAQSDQLNRSIQAKAFTTGQDIFFKQGEYQPGSKGGQELLAHELTHVVQQTGAGGKVQRQFAPSTTSSSATATAPPTNENWDGIVQTELEQFLDRFSNIQVQVKWVEYTATQCVEKKESVGVHPPYFINKDGERKTKALKNQQQASKEVKDLLAEIKRPQEHKRGGMGMSRTLVGKSTPEDIQAILQQAIDRNLVKPPKGRDRLNSDDLHDWLVKYGIGVDCSGFVSQALNQVMMRIVGRPLAPNQYIEAGSDGLKGGTNKFAKVKSPAELHPGDTMHIPGHIRIITSVQTTTEGYIQFTTAESSSVDDIGPTANVWRYENPSNFKELKRKKDDKWVDGDVGKTVTFGHYKVLQQATEPATGITTTPTPQIQRQVLDRESTSSVVQRRLTAFPVEKTPIQTKREPGVAGNKYEQEAEQVANQLMAKNEVPVPELISVGQKPTESENLPVIRRKPPVDPEAARVAKLKRDYNAAVKNKNWQKAALLLNGFNDADILLRVQGMKQFQLSGIYEGALRSMPGWSDRVTKPIDQLNPEVARVARLKFNYEISVEKGEWAKAAEYLNGFNDADIISKLKEFGDDGKLEALKKGAEKQMPGWAGRITNPIDGLMKSRDPSLKIADLIPQKGLKGLELRMATIYNTKGKYLEDKATELSIDSASAAAVLYVESSGAGFNDAGRMIIRFENHVFFDNWGKSNVKEFKKYFKFNSNEKWKGHYFRVIETDAWRSFHGEQNIEWEVFEFARALNEEAALKSISMGLGQVMGFNYSKTGFSSVKDMFDSMSGSLRLQLDGMFNFFKNTPLCIKGLKEKDYVKFATGYNGTGQAAQYGANIKAAADAYIKVIQKHKTTNSSK